MLNTELWVSFVQGLTADDVSDIEKNVAFLRVEMADALLQSTVEDVSSDLDRTLHIYLQYSCLSGNDEITPWLIHDRWFYYYSDGVGLNPELKNTLLESFNQYDADLLQHVRKILKCIDCGSLIQKEVDAVVWLTFLDYLVSNLISQLGRNRLMGIFREG